MTDRWSRRAFAVLASLLLVIATACSSGGNNTGTADQPGNAGNNESAGEDRTAAEPGEPADPLGKYDPPIEVVAVRDLMAGSTEADMNDNIINQYYEKDLGIKLKYKWTVIGDQYEQRVNLTLASGDLPDMMVVNLRQLHQMIDAGQVEDLTAAWENYASDDLKQSLTANGMDSFEMATVDGKLYGIPLITPMVDTAHALFIREDWRQKLGLPEPKTYEDLEKIMYAFATQDPTGTGKKTYGLNITKDLYTNGFDITSFANMFHAYPNAWIEDESGNIVYGSVQPEMKEALAALQKLYKDGLIDKEFTVRDEGKAGEAVIKEQVGAFFGVQWTHWISGAGVDLYKKNLESDWKVYPIPSIDGTPAKVNVYNNTNSFLVVRKGFEHPEAGVKMLNWIHLMGHGPQPIPYEEWQELWANWGYAFLRPETIHANMQRWLNTFEALETGDTSKVEKNYLNKEQYEDIKAFVEQGDKMRKSNKEEDKEWAKVRWGWMLSGRVFQIADEYEKNGRLMIDKRGAYVSPAMLEKQATLSKLEQSTFTRIITGESSIDEFDKFVKEWENLGGKEITQELNEWAKK